MQSICIFEDEACAQLYPLAHTRPVYDLVCGITSLREKIIRSYTGCNVILQCRDQLTEVLRKENPGVNINTMPEGDCLFINGRILADPGLHAHIPLKGEDAFYFSGDTLVAARLTEKKIKETNVSLPFIMEKSPVEKKLKVDLEVIRYPWDLIEYNEKQIEQDFNALVGSGFIQGERCESVSLIEEDKVYVGKAVKMKPGVVFDAEHGPIYIGEGTIISSNAVIEGPVAIGSGTEIKAGAKISKGTTIGSVCRVGGEVGHSILLSFTNKQHEGYLGHSYIGSWVNLGAGTTISDLKNNYHSVKVQMNGKLLDTGLLFVGLIMGDHSKSGINTMFNSGTIVGVSCNVFGADYPQKFIPCFSWGGSTGLTEYNLEKAIGTAKMVMGRRGKELTLEEEKVLRYVFQLTAGARR